MSKPAPLKHDQGIAVSVGVVSDQDGRGLQRGIDGDTCGIVAVVGHEKDDGRFRHVDSVLGLGLVLGDQKRCS